MGKRSTCGARSNRIKIHISSLLITVLFLPVITLAQSISWHPCARPYGGGYINNTAFDSSGDVYAAVGSFGIYMSTDNGETWKQDNVGHGR